MYRYAILSLVVALVAGCFALGLAVAAAMVVAKVLFVLALLLAVAGFAMGWRTAAPR